MSTSPPRNTHKISELYLSHKLRQRFNPSSPYLWVKCVREQFSKHLSVPFRFSCFCGVEDNSFLSLGQSLAHQFGGEFNCPRSIGNLYLNVLHVRICGYSTPACNQHMKNRPFRLSNDITQYLIVTYFRGN